MNKPLIVVRGGGDIATGTIHRLWCSGFNVVVLETHRPSAIRRTVSLCEAVYQGETTVEGATAILVETVAQIPEIFKKGQIPLLIDPQGDSIPTLAPMAVVDGILAKKNLGTHQGMAPLTIALGPGFEAGNHVDAVIETQRGHNLGRVITQGYAAPNTGIPGEIKGVSTLRVIHASCPGTIVQQSAIGDLVTQGQTIATIQSPQGEVSVLATISGVLRGLIPEGFVVTKGFKIADIDPRSEQKANCHTISDKARCIAGSVLEVVVSHLMNQGGTQ